MIKLAVTPETVARSGDQVFVRVHRARVFAEVAPVRKIPDLALPISAEAPDASLRNRS